MFCPNHLEQVLCDLKYDDVTLASMHSISKGFYGECGRRGGYTELVNVSPEVVSEIYKLASINLCSNLNGQICMALVMQPPKVCLYPCTWVSSFPMNGIKNFTGGESIQSLRLFNVAHRWS